MPKATVINQGDIVILFGVMLQQGYNHEGSACPGKGESLSGVEGKGANCLVRIIPYY